MGFYAGVDLNQNVTPNQLKAIGPSPSLDVTVNRQPPTANSTEPYQVSVLNSLYHF